HCDVNHLSTGFVDRAVVAASAGGNHGKTARLDTGNHYARRLLCDVFWRGRRRYSSLGLFPQLAHYLNHINNHCADRWRIWWLCFCAFSVLGQVDHLSWPDADPFGPRHCFVVAAVHALFAHWHHRHAFWTDYHLCSAECAFHDLVD